jgi:hypothetical protein
MNALFQGETTASYKGKLLYSNRLIQKQMLYTRMILNSVKHMLLNLGPE